MQQATQTAGSLYVVATPIGNLEDITLRALRILKEADIIACEDTRHTRKLLTHHGIHGQLTSYHDHNKEEKAPVLIDRMGSGQSVALVSDAGTPLINDPGYYLVNLCHEAGLPVVPVPGPSALTAALSVAGIPTDAFTYLGYLPPKGAARRNRLEKWKDHPHTLVFYESPHRIGKALADMLAVLGDRRAALCRELTKLHEEVVHAPLSELAARFAAGKAKGEFTVLVEGLTRKARKKRPPSQPPAR